MTGPVKVDPGSGVEQSGSEDCGVASTESGVVGQSAPGRFCPTCDLPLAEGAVVCTECGYDIVNGSFIAGVAPPEEPPVPLAVRLTVFCVDCFPGFSRPGVVVASALIAALAAFLGFFSMLVFGLGAYLTAGWLGVVALLVWAQALALICVGRFEFLKSALADMEGAHFQVFLALVLAPPVALWVFLGTLAAGGG